MVALFDEMDSIFIIVLEGTDETGLCCQVSMAFQVVRDNKSAGIAFVLQERQASILCLVDLAVHLLKEEKVVSLDV